MSYEDRIFWIFYLLDEDFYGTSKYDIYAYTDSKDIAKRFKETRDMKKFFMKRVKLDSDGFNNIVRYYSSNELENFTGKLRVEDKNISKNFSIPITRREKQHVKNMASLYLNEYLCNAAWYDAGIYKSKYFNALNELLYVGVHASMYFQTYDENTWEILQKRMNSNDFNILYKNFSEVLTKDVN